MLVDGVDVGGGVPAEGATCRLYDDGGKLTGVPSVERIVAGLRADSSARVVAAGSHDELQSSFRTALASAPGVGIALLPKLACPACWPAYAAVLSALGLGFLMQSRYLVLTTIALLTLATSAIAFRARARRGYAPAFVAAAAAAALIVAKFVFESDPLTYASTATFALAALWNAWPKRRVTACSACVSDSSTPTV